MYKKEVESSERVSGTGMIGAGGRRLPTLGKGVSAISQSIKTGSFRWMKSINKSTILNVIRLQGPLSRAEIAKVTHLTPPTVTNIVSELLREGWVVECELGESTGGRKPILLNINHKAFNVVGVYAGVKTIRVLSADLAGNTGEERLLSVPARPSGKIYADLLIEAVGSVADRIREKGIPLLGIGVGMHGLVDPREGVSRFAPNLPFSDLPLRSILEEKFSVSVEVENDVRARAVGESWFGHGRGADPFICVHVGTGVGAGMMYEGRLLYGPTFTAGELGHTVIDPAGPACGCGNRGCLEAFVSGSCHLGAGPKASGGGGGIPVADPDGSRWEAYRSGSDQSCGGRGSIGRRRAGRDRTLFGHCTGQSDQSSEPTKNYPEWRDDCCR